MGNNLVQIRRVGTAGTEPANVTETVAVNTQKYGRHGRLFKVVEPSGAGGSDVVTTYTYDLGNRLAQVSTTAGEVTQVRKFTYDKRGFLISEQHPEKGPNGNGLVSYFDYDARGHAHRRLPHKPPSFSMASARCRSSRFRLEGAVNGGFDGADSAVGKTRLLAFSSACRGYGVVQSSRYEVESRCSGSEIISPRGAQRRS